METGAIGVKVNCKILNAINLIKAEYIGFVAMLLFKLKKKTLGSN